MAKKLKPKLFSSDERFLVVFNDDRNRTVGNFLITTSLADAKKAPSVRPKAADPKTDETQPKTENTVSFASLQSQISQTIASHRGLENVMALLNLAKGDIHFHFAVKPILEKYASIAWEADKDRTIYSFRRAHAREVISALRTASAGVKGINQLPRLLIIGLVSEYDVFLQKLIRAGLAAQQNITNQIKGTLRLDQLSQFATIQEASDFLIDREIDEILRDDHQNQIVKINDLFHVKVDTDDSCVRNFLEICERRNLFTHNAGLVNAQYLARCKQFKIDTSRLKPGQRLDAGRQYFRGAISTIHELSIKLTQYIWRSLLPTERDKADEELNQTAYELTQNDDYQLAERLLDYCLNHTGKGNDRTRRMMVINYANAIKLGGDKKRAEAELAKYDWSATNIDFQISVAAIKDDFKQVVEMMKSATRNKDLSEDDFREWPVFKTVRGEKAFQDEFRSIFEKDLISTANLSARSDLPLAKKEQRDSAEVKSVLRKIAKH